jgi:hypothetical protein
MYHENFETDMEKTLWEMLYKSQLALAKVCLEERNRSREEENDWPAGQTFTELGGSSKATFFGTARDVAKIDHDKYLHILRGYGDALEIADRLLEEEEVSDEMR